MLLVKYPKTLPSPIPRLEFRIAESIYQKPFKYPIMWVSNSGKFFKHYNPKQNKGLKTKFIIEINKQMTFIHDCTLDIGRFVYNLYMIFINYLSFEKSCWSLGLGNTWFVRSCVSNDVNGTEIPGKFYVIHKIIWTLYTPGLFFFVLPLTR